MITTNHSWWHTIKNRISSAKNLLDFWISNQTMREINSFTYVTDKIEDLQEYNQVS